MSYILCCNDPVHQVESGDASSVVTLWSALRRSVVGGRVVPMADGDDIPECVAVCTSVPPCVVASGTEWGERQSRADWVPYQSGHTWTGTEKAVLVPELDGTADMAATLGIAWADCERIAAGVTVPGVGVTTQRMAVVRYTGAKPAALASYSPTIYAADLPGVLAVAEPA